MSTALPFKHPRPFTINPQTINSSLPYFNTVTITTEQAENLWWNLNGISVIPQGEATTPGAVAWSFQKEFPVPPNWADPDNLGAPQLYGTMCGDLITHTTQPVTNFPAEPRSRVGVSPTSMRFLIALTGFVVAPSDLENGTFYLGLTNGASPGEYLLHYQFSFTKDATGVEIVLQNPALPNPGLTGQFNAVNGTSDFGGISLAWKVWLYPAGSTITGTFSLELAPSFYAY